MKIQIRINPLALYDLKEIKDHISENNEKSAIKIVSEIFKQIESLSEFPHKGTSLSIKIEMKTNYRYFCCGNYIVFYLYDKNIVSVQRVLHGKRDYLRILFREENKEK